jgi:predicted Zn-dependent protease with MMP-like domain
MSADPVVEALLTEAEEALAEGDAEGAERTLRRALKLAPNHRDVSFLLGDALRDQGRLDEAEGLYRAVVLGTPGDADAWAALAGALLFQLRWSEAHKAANRALREDPGHPEAAYIRGVLRERRGDYPGAQRDFLRAWTADPALWSLPVPLDDETVEEVVVDTLEALHPTLREYLADIPILLEEFPSDEVLQQYDPPAYPTELLGYFSGHSLMERSTDDPWSGVPGAIVLFRRNLQRFARDREHLLEELRITLFHEVGHFLGLDEKDMEDRGLD